jgi:glutathione S-transferase
MDIFSLENPVFQTYMIAASIAILKMLGHAYLVVYNMLRVSGGFLNPEDLRKTVGNPNPSATQTDPNERVERARRMHRNEGENTPLFLVAGLLFVAAAPAPALAPWLLYGYLVARFLHFGAYATAQDHEVRAVFYTIGTVFIAALAGFALYAAVTH